MNRGPFKAVSYYWMVCYNGKRYGEHIRFKKDAMKYMSTLTQCLQNLTLEKVPNDQITPLRPGRPKRTGTDN